MLGNIQSANSRAYNRYKEKVAKAYHAVDSGVICSNLATGTKMTARARRILVANIINSLRLKGAFSD